MQMYWTELNTTQLALSRQCFGFFVCVRCGVKFKPAFMLLPCFNFKLKVSVDECETPLLLVNDCDFWSNYGGVGKSVKIGFICPYFDQQCILMQHTTTGTDKSWLEANSCFCTKIREKSATLFEMPIDRYICSCYRCIYRVHNCNNKRRWLLAG